MQQCISNNSQARGGLQMENSNKKESNKYRNSFANNLKNYRKKSDFTQEKLAEAIASSTTIISAYENKSKEPKLTSLIKLANVLGITLNELCGIDKETQTEEYIKRHLAATTITVLEQLKTQVHVDGNTITLTLSPKNDCSKEGSECSSEYSTQTILQFFQEYETIQKFCTLDPTPSMLKKLKENLVNDYKSMPDFLPYERIKKKTTSED